MKALSVRRGYLACHLASFFLPKNQVFLVQKHCFKPFCLYNFIIENANKCNQRRGPTPNGNCLNFSIFYFYFLFLVVLVHGLYLARYVFTLFSLIWFGHRQKVLLHHSILSEDCISYLIMNCSLYLLNTFSDVL